MSLSLIAVACGDDDAGTDTTAGTTGETTATTAAPDDPYAARGAAADAFDMYNAMSGQERTDALIAAAQEEGSVAFYTASSGMDPVIEAFEDTYDINVDLFVGQSDTVLQRLQQEFEAGFYGVDVFDDAEAFTVSRLGMTYEYINPPLTDPIPGYDPATHVAATRLSVYTQGWNLDLVDEATVPGDIAGFATEEWCGRMSMDPRDWVWYIGVSDYYIAEEGWTQEQVDDMFRELAQCTRFDRGHTTQAQLLLAGEFDASLTVYTQSVDRELEKDATAPIAWRKSDGSWVRPLVFFPQGATLMKNAPHPAAAMLFLDFLLTEGQRLLAIEDRTPTAIAQPGGPLEGIPNDELYQVDFDKFYDRETWATRFDELLATGS
jgi:iron(III) transport system substrate-binding protein